LIVPGKKKSRPSGRDSQITCHSGKNLGSTTLAVSILVVFFLVLVLALTALLGLLLPSLSALLTRLAAVLTLSVLPGLSTLLALSGLTALLTLLLHIVCHDYSSEMKRELTRAFKIC
jgi:hypothetical protein